HATNIGAVIGRNQALEVCRGDFIVFMDNDVMVKDPKWLSKLHSVLTERDRRGIVSGKLLFPWSPYLIEFAGGAVSPQGRVGYLGRGEPRNAPEHNVERECQCVISACIMIKGELIDEVGKLDEAYSPVQYEDIDLCYRARSLGWQVWYTPRVEMWHFENVTTAGSTDLKFKYLTIKNGLTFKRRWRHAFERECGPSDEELRWRELPRHTVEEVFGDALWDDDALLQRLMDLSRV
ncbi:MAG TPA: glycosyltransferase family 2 protein, partial [Armatimonadetes bacterium]|nr:glycosyltransferase family 2 protein [Armatimonadota bacterium]